MLCATRSVFLTLRLSTTVELPIEFDDNDDDNVVEVKSWRHCINAGVLWFTLVDVLSDCSWKVVVTRFKLFTVVNKLL